MAPDVDATPPVMHPLEGDERSFQIMGTRVYVGNLPFDTDAAQLRALFEEGGREVSDVKIITDRDTGRPRGFAFVEMGSQSDAKAAITALNGREIGGRALTVNEAKEQAPRRGGGGGFRGGRGGYRGY
jgi:RNA recognition motif-containing protein